MSRKLDAAIAEALGYEVFWVGDGRLDVPRYKSKKCSSWPSRPVRHYSTDGYDVLILLEEEMWERGWRFKLHSESPQEWVATIWRMEDQLEVYCEVGKRLPKAVALAAYHALTGKEWGK